jgi:hypothetical protein
MSNAHKGSRLILKDQVVATEFNSFHADFNVDATGIHYGQLIEPLEGSIYTMRPNEGKFGGGVAVEEGTTNACLKDGQDGNSPWSGDGTGATSTIDSAVTFRGRKVARYKPGTAGNNYINSNKIDSSITSTEWVFRLYIKRVDGTAITSLNRYMYVANNSNQNGAVDSIREVEEGWYEVIATRTGLVSGYVTLFGLYGMSDTEYYIADWQLEPKSFPTSYTVGTRGSGILKYPILPNASQGSIHFWVKLNNYPTTRYCIFVDSHGTSTIGRMYLAHNGNKLYWHLSNSSGSGAISLSTDNYSDSFAFVALKWDSSGRTMFFGKPDGSGLVKQYSQDVYFPSWRDSLLVGARLGGEHANAIFCDFSYINKSLSDEEVNAIYLSQKPLYNPYDYRSFSY